MFHMMVTCCCQCVQVRCVTIMLNGNFHAHDYLLPQSCSKVHPIPHRRRNCKQIWTSSYIHAWNSLAEQSSRSTCSDRSNSETTIAVAAGVVMRSMQKQHSLCRTAMLQPWQLPNSSTKRHCCSGIKNMSWQFWNGSQ